MKRYSIVFLFLIYTINNNAQDSAAYRLKNISDAFSISTLDVLDSYLSPLAYSGIGIRYERNKSQFLLKKNDKFSMYGHFASLAGIALNPKYTSSLTYIGLAYKWGVYYHFDEFYGIRMFAGANIGAGYAYKMNDRNINNPYNMDMYTDLNLAGLIKYDIHTGNRILNLNYRFDFPLLGCMFVPESGASYYEIADMGVLTNAFHFSSLHNRSGFNSFLGLEIPFNHATWTVGFGQSILKYKANDLFFRIGSTYLSIGLKYDLYVFAGKKNRAPAIFRNAHL